jgi:nucleotide-binding universal stress UspA family protein
MKLWRNVLVHVDGKDTPNALEKSLLVAEAFGGRVIAFDSIEAASEPLPFHFPTLRVDHLMEFAATARTEQLRDELAALEQRVPVEALVGRGEPGRALLGCAARSGTDLIVKATSAGDVRQLTVSGTAALHLLRASQVPVWLYAPPPHRSGRVVAAVNLSNPAPEHTKLNEHVVLAAARLSRLESAELHVVCVADRARDRVFESILRPAEYRHFLAKDRSELRRSLTDLTNRLAPRAVPHLVEGNALEVIEKMVHDLEADAVTLGRDDADARGGIGGYLAERLFCRIDRSVLLVAPGPGLARSRVNPRALGGLSRDDQGSAMQG